MLRHARLCKSNRYFTAGQLLGEASGSKQHINSTDGPIMKVLCSPYCSCAVALAPFNGQLPGVNVCKPAQELVKRGKKRSESELPVWIRYEFEGEYRRESPLKTQLQLRTVRNIKAAVWYAVCAEHSTTSPLVKKEACTEFPVELFHRLRVLTGEKQQISWADGTQSCFFNYVLNSCKLINSWMSWIITRHASFWTFGHCCIDADLGSSHPGPACKYLILPCIKLSLRARNK